MDDKIIKTFEMDNGQVLVITDESRKIGADAYLVVMKACVDIKIDEALFADTPISEFQFSDIKAVLGDSATYEYKLERNFIHDHQKDDVLSALVDSFLSNMGQYIEKKVFPAKFVIKTYKDRL